MKLPEGSEGNFFMFLKTNEGYLSQIALKDMQLMPKIDLERGHLQTAGNYKITARCFCGKTKAISCKV